MQNLGIIFGGIGPEHEASLASARALIDNFDPKKYRLTLYGINKDGNWVKGDGAWDELYRLADVDKLPGSIRGIELRGGATQLYKKYPPIDVFSELDCIFPVVDGVGGEDGTLQGFLSFVEKNVVGCSLLPAALAYDKWQTKKLVKAEGIQTAKAVLLSDSLEMDDMVALIKEEFGYSELIVKPNRCGSSIGVSYISGKSNASFGVNLKNAIKEAKKHDTEVLVEEYIDNVELFVGVAGLSKDIVVAQPAIDRPWKKRHTTYADKYYSSEYKTICLDVEDVNEEEKYLFPRVKEAQEIAQRVYETLGCDGYARVDLFYCRKTQELLFNELNTTPAIAPNCAFPKGLKIKGYSYSALLDRLVNDAMKKSSNQPVKTSMPNLRLAVSN